MNALTLSPKEKKKLKTLTSRPFKKMTSKQKKMFLQLGAKDFGNRFGDTLKRLANE